MRFEKDGVTHYGQFSNVNEDMADIFFSRI